MMLHRRGRCRRDRRRRPAPLAPSLAACLLLFFVDQATTVVFVNGQGGGGEYPTDGVRGIPFPFQRYVFWSSLDQESRQFAVDMGYRPVSWDLPGSADVEALSYETIQMEDDQTAFEGLIGLGYEEEQWDCFIVRNPRS